MNAVFEVNGKPLPSLHLRSSRFCRRAFLSIRRSSSSVVFKSKRRGICPRMEATSLSTYNPRLFQKRHSLFETCLTELVRHIDEAPLLQSLHVFDDFTFQRRSLSNTQVELDPNADVLVLCQSIPKRPKNAKSHSTVFAGKVGDCCDHETPLPYESMQNAFWGLVVKSTTFPELQGCFLMHTCRSLMDHCSCTHFSVTRISLGIPLEEQYNASWLV